MWTLWSSVLSFKVKFHTKAIHWSQKCHSFYWFNLWSLKLQYVNCVNLYCPSKWKQSIHVQCVFICIPGTTFQTFIVLFYLIIEPKHDNCVNLYCPSKWKQSMHVQCIPGTTFQTFIVLFYLIMLIFIVIQNGSSLWTFWRSFFMSQRKAWFHQFCSKAIHSSSWWKALIT